MLAFARFNPDPTVLTRLHWDATGLFSATDVVRGVFRFSLSRQMDGVQGVLLTMVNGSGTLTGLLFRKNTDDTFRLQFTSSYVAQSVRTYRGDGTGTGNSGDNDEITIVATVTRAVMNYDIDSGFYIFVNGILREQVLGKSSVTGSTLTDTQAVYIGANRPGAASLSPWIGDVEQVRIWAQPTNTDLMVIQNRMSYSNNTGQGYSATTWYSGVATKSSVAPNVYFHWDGWQSDLAVIGGHFTIWDNVDNGGRGYLESEIADHAAATPPQQGYGTMAILVPGAGDGFEKWPAYYQNLGHEWHTTLTGKVIDGDGDSCTIAAIPPIDMLDDRRVGYEVGLGDSGSAVAWDGVSYRGNYIDWTTTPGANMSAMIATPANDGTVLTKTPRLFVGGGGAESWAINRSGIGGTVTPPTLKIVRPVTWTLSGTID